MRRYTYNGVDRLDSSMGYTPDNCVPCCWECNNMKGASLTEEEMMAVAETLRKIRGMK